MKKIIFILLFICAESLAANAIIYKADDSFTKSLKLSKKQAIQIEQIKKDYSKEIADINSQIILKNMQIAKYRNKREYLSVYTSLNKEINFLNKELNEIQKQKDKDILKKLNFFQKRKYKKYISNLY